MHFPGQAQQPLPAKVLVVGLPKSGTYLMGALLENLGLADTKMHLFEHGYSDYAGAGLDEARLNPQKFKRQLPLNDSVKKIQRGQFAVGHLRFSVPCLQVTSGLRRIFLIRELRHCLVSYMRFVHSTQRFGAAQQPWFSFTDPKERMTGFLETFGAMFLEELYRPMMGWMECGETLTVRFEDLTGPPDRSHRTIDAIAAYVGARLYDANQALHASLATDTLTKSPRQSSLDHFWSDEAEQKFTKLGYPAVNKRFGYAPELPLISKPDGAACTTSHSSKKETAP